MKIAFSIHCAFLLSLLCEGNFDLSADNLRDVEKLYSGNKNSSSTEDVLNLDYNNMTILNLTLAKTMKFATPCETPNHDPGFCIGISQCPLLKQLTNEKHTDFIRASRCGPQNEDPRNPKVCCGKYNNFRNVSTAIADDVNIFPKKCGVQKPILNDRIIGGEEALLGEYPWMAVLIHKNHYGYKSNGCAGFLIHSKYVLTAAHCIESNNSAIRGPLFQVALGEHNTDTDEDCNLDGRSCSAPVQRSRINKVMVHPKYSKNSKDHHYDIALVHLSKGAKLSDYVQPICLLEDGNQHFSKFYLSGWGSTETREFSPVKLKVDLDPFNKEECKRKYALLNLDIDDTQICVGGGKYKDSCTGDSGGPLMVSPNGTTFFAAGLVSYGIGCGYEGWPGVYTSIPSYINWIKKEILATSTKDVKRKRENRTREASQTPV